MNAPVENNLPLIEMVDVSIAADAVAGSREIVGINWRVSVGDFWAIGGLHGSGKSNLISTAAGLQRPSKGILKVFGHDLFDLHEHELLKERLRIGMVFENGGRIFSNLTVSENVGLPLRYHHNWSPAEAQAAVNEVLQLTDLEQFAHNTPGMLNPSWQQRVGLARALALKPEILLLERPLAGLELRHRRWWLDFLRQLSAGIAFTNSKPVALVVTTDNLEIWADQARQFAVLKNNRWHVLGGQAELRASNETLVRELWSDDLNEAEAI